jgi:hypothetical protein
VFQAKDAVLSEVQALKPNHEARLEAIERAEKLRKKELMMRGAGGKFEDELEEFVGEQKLKKSGGIEETERRRRLRDQQALKEARRTEGTLSSGDNTSRPMQAVDQHEEGDSAQDRGGDVEGKLNSDGNASKGDETNGLNVSSRFHTPQQSLDGQSGSHSASSLNPLERTPEQGEEQASEHTIVAEHIGEQSGVENGATDGDYDSAEPVEPTAISQGIAGEGALRREDSGHVENFYDAEVTIPEIP